MQTFGMAHQKGGHAPLQPGNSAVAIFELTIIIVNYYNIGKSVSLGDSNKF